MRTQKTLLIIIIFFVSVICNAQVKREDKAVYSEHIKPFVMELKSARASYMEGESIELILSLKNNDSLKTFAVLVPGLKHSSKKLIQIVLAGNIKQGNHLYPIHLLEEERISTQLLSPGILTVCGVTIVMPS